MTGSSSRMSAGRVGPIWFYGLHTIFVATAVIALESPKHGFSQAWSSDGAHSLPGGSYKMTNTQTFPGSSDMSASLVQIVPGGLRSTHWHDAAEWSYVLNGTCRSTVIQAGGNRSTEAYDYGTGDIWVYGANEAHMVQGQKEGCTYLSVYNTGTLEEREAMSFSAWVSTTNQVDAAQGLQVPMDTFRESMKDAKATFLPLGPLPNTTIEDYRASIGAPPGHPVPQTHRFELSHAPNKTGSAGGYVKQADTNNFPVSGVAGMSGALVKLVPQGMREMHWHTNANEWQYVINGTIRTGVNPRPGVVGEAILHAGDVGFAPRGVPHHFKNAGCTDAFVLLVFDAGVFNTLDVTHVTANLPAQIVATDLNVSLGFAETFNVNITTVVPPPPANKTGACLT